MAWPSMVVVNCGNALRRASWARQSKPVRQYSASPAGSRAGRRGSSPSTGERRPASGCAASRLGEVVQGGLRDVDAERRIVRSGGVRHGVNLPFIAERIRSSMCGQTSPHVDDLDQAAALAGPAAARRDLVGRRAGRGLGRHHAHRAQRRRPAARAGLSRCTPRPAWRAATGWAPAPRCRRCCSTRRRRSRSPSACAPPPPAPSPASRRPRCGRWPSWSR